MYQSAIHVTACDEYDQLADIVKEENSNTIDSSKFSATSVDAKTKETGTSDTEYDNEINHTPNMQVFDYEEPIKHKPFYMSCSKNSYLLTCIHYTLLS